MIHFFHIFEFLSTKKSSLKYFNLLNCHYSLIIHPIIQNDLNLNSIKNKYNINYVFLIDNIDLIFYKIFEFNLDIHFSHENGNFDYRSVV